ncbi:MULTISPECIES: MATE family efflux transporter [Actinomyces]|uniref:MATE family efflux transporter n=1 Tax=Actinomyces respiraculi TaxID=2744574 RepID=A0A7T0LL83_9ACTO|nr:MULTISPECIES: MATE family efflux transporter [Actinomyces]QPL05501.1 MATE family efflux transporter [Actinomyces respiraculi]
MPTPLTEGTPWRVIGAFTVPLVLGNIIQQAYQLADTIVVGRFLGVLPLASVGATGVLLFLVIGFSFGMTSGLTIPLSQAYGAQDEVAVRRSVAAGTLVSVALTVVLTVIGTVLLRPLLVLFRTPAELMDDAMSYGLVCFATSCAIVAFNYLSAIIRAVGDSRTPLVFLAIASGLNIVLDIALIAWFGMGVEGAAYATAIAEVASALLCLWWIRLRFPVFHLRREDWRVTRAELAHHLRMGAPLGFNMSIIAIGAVAMQVRLNELGSDAVAAFTTAIRIDGLANSTLSSIGLAVSTYVAQNFGARRLDRVRLGVRQGNVLALVTSLVLALILVPTAAPLSRVFVGDGSEQVVTLSAQAVIMFSLTYWILAILYVMRGALQGLGKMRAPFYSGVAELVMRVIAAVWLGGLFGYLGVCASEPLAWVGAVALLVPAYLRTRRRLLGDDARTARSGVVT